jgi:K+:H+ antiporter
MRSSERSRRGSVMPRTHRLERVTRRRLEPVVVTVLLPVFFVVVGLSTRIERLDGWYLCGIAFLFTGVAIAGKFGGATIAARSMGDTWRDAAGIGVLMNTRLTELVILTVGLELRSITDTVFTIGVLMAWSRLSWPPRCSV